MKLAQMKTVEDAAPGVAHGCMDDELGFHLRRSQVAAFKHFGQTVTAAEGITPGLYGMLQVIANNSGLTQSALAEAMDVDRSSIVKVVNQLEDKRLIVRDASPTDRRSYCLRLTSFGRNELARIEQAVTAQDREFSKALSEAERHTLIGLLKRLYK
ncbi:transcriptional regulator [Paramagnetospirillum marisnigri]|uniref:Transcriptional regulator n=1 Tax=Paramagnetospirillum marisnigri TaxID=1285242 RepID=A0A178M9K1_9PROT|nr:MarR family transcriptional regulator [Paramagnetospirillum marisnigri]OAN44715.1 transcriptional regulator [Paramagnetospirillum marisnigri]